MSNLGKTGLERIVFLLFLLISFIGGKTGNVSAATQLQIDGSTHSYIMGGNIGIGTTNPGAKLDVAGQVKITGGTPGTGKVLTSDASGLATWEPVGIPTGIIVMWSGLLANIPAAWALCDGTSGTPDLRDRFILGTSTSENPGAVGGSSTYTLSTAQLPSHTHSIQEEPKHLRDQTGGRPWTAPAVRFGGPGG